MDGQKRNTHELKKQMEINQELKERVIDLETKKSDIQKRLVRETKALRSELTEAKSKIYEQTLIKGK